MEPWEFVVWLYSSRKATLHSDKLVALSAVARTYSENNHEYGTYFAGLWENSMPVGLLWNVEGEDILPRPSDYTAPTWSWASVGGAVRYKNDDLEVDDDFEIIRVQTTTANSNGFGAVTDGTLVLDARVRDCRVVKRWKEMPTGSPWSFLRIFEGPKMVFDADTMEFWTSLCNDSEVTLLIMGDKRERIYGLVLTKHIKSDTFSRAGFFEFSHQFSEIESQQEYDGFFEGFEIKRVTII